MADVRALLKEQQAARRIDHPHVTYSTTGRLICLPCNLQLKSESLWAGHQRSPNHQKKLKEAQDTVQAVEKAPSSGSRSSGKPITQNTITIAPSLKRRQDGEGIGSESPSKKRKAQREMDSDGDMNSDETIRKRSKSAAEPAPPKPKHDPTLPGFLPEGFFDNGVAGQEAEVHPQPQAPKTPAQKKDTITPPMPNGEFTLASRPLTPMDTSRSASRSGSKPLTPMDVGTPSKTPLSRSSTLATAAAAGSGEEEKKEAAKGDVDEDEWAAFEADIAAAEAMPEDAVITAAPVSAEDLANMTVEETYLSKRARIESEREQEKEDIINKALDEQEEMKELEARVNKLKARTEEVKKLREKAKEEHKDDKPLPEAPVEASDEEEEDSDDGEDDEDWLRG